MHIEGINRHKFFLIPYPPGLRIPTHGQRPAISLVRVPSATILSLFKCVRINFTHRTPPFAGSSHISLRAWARLDRTGRLAKTDVKLLQVSVVPQRSTAGGRDAAKTGDPSPYSTLTGMPAVPMHPLQTRCVSFVYMSLFLHTFS